MKTWGSGCINPPFLNSTLLGDEWSASRSGRFAPRERVLGTHWIGSWVVPRAGLDDVDGRKFLILPGLKLRPFSRPARSQSLHRLRYQTSLKMTNKSTVRVQELRQWV
jgi:hypothetical protein